MALTARSAGSIYDRSSGRRRARVASLLVHDVDWLLVAATAGLCVIGAGAVYAATRDQLLSAGSSGSYYLKRDLINLVVGCVLATPALVISYRTIRAFVWPIYGAVCFLLVAVLGVGETINGARAWFSLGLVQLEPSEFAKIAVILAVSAVVTETPWTENKRQARTVGLAVATLAFPLLLIMAEPALGIAIIIGVCGLTVMATGGIKARWILALLGGMVVAVLLMLSLHLIKPYQEQRFTYLVNPNAASSSTGYQIEQSRIAVGSGGLRGEGFLNGSQTNGGFVPERQTDFIFTVVAEESGFLGSSLLLALFSVLVWRALVIARRAEDPYAQCVAAGIAMWFAFQGFTNIGMTMGIMPVTGVPLPFVSYGGSATFASLIAVGLLLNINARAR